MNGMGIAIANVGEHFNNIRKPNVYLYSLLFWITCLFNSYNAVELFPSKLDDITFTEQIGDPYLKVSNLKVRCDAFDGSIVLDQNSIADPSQPINLTTDRDVIFDSLKCAYLFIQARNVRFIGISNINYLCIVATDEFLISEQSGIVCEEFIAKSPNFLNYGTFTGTEISIIQDLFLNYGTCAGQKFALQLNSFLNFGAVLGQHIVLQSDLLINNGQIGSPNSALYFIIHRSILNTKDIVGKSGEITTISGNNVFRNNGLLNISTANFQIKGLFENTGVTSFERLNGYIQTLVNSSKFIAQEGSLSIDSGENSHILALSDLHCSGDFFNNFTDSDSEMRVNKLIGLGKFFNKSGFSLIERGVIGIKEFHNLNADFIKLYNAAALFGNVRLTPVIRNSDISILDLARNMYDPLLNILKFVLSNNRQLIISDPTLCCIRFFFNSIAYSPRMLSGMTSIFDIFARTSKSIIACMSEDTEEFPTTLALNNLSNKPLLYCAIKDLDDKAESAEPYLHSTANMLKNALAIFGGLGGLVIDVQEVDRRVKSFACLVGEEQFNLTVGGTLLARSAFYTPENVIAVEIVHEDIPETHIKQDNSYTLPIGDLLVVANKLTALEIIEAESINEGIDEGLSEEQALKQAKEIGKVYQQANDCDEKIVASEDKLRNKIAEVIPKLKKPVEARHDEVYAVDEAVVHELVAQLSNSEKIEIVKAAVISIVEKKAAINELQTSVSAEEPTSPLAKKQVEQLKKLAGISLDVLGDTANLVVAGDYRAITDCIQRMIDLLTAVYRFCTTAIMYLIMWFVFAIVVVYITKLTYSVGVIVASISRIVRTKIFKFAIYVYNSVVGKSTNNAINKSTKITTLEEKIIAFYKQ